MSQWGANEVTGDDRIVKISLVGVGMRSHAGIASRMFQALAAENINIQMISTSEIKISVVVDEKYLELGVRALHDAFGLAENADAEPGVLIAGRLPLPADVGGGVRVGLRNGRVDRDGAALVRSKRAAWSQGRCRRGAGSRSQVTEEDAMLILTRRVGESLMIGDDVTVTVLGVKGNQVRSESTLPGRWWFTARRSTSGSGPGSRRRSCRPGTAPPSRAEGGTAASPAARGEAIIAPAGEYAQPAGVLVFVGVRRFLQLSRTWSHRRDFAASLPPGRGGSMVVFEPGGNAAISAHVSNSIA